MTVIIGIALLQQGSTNANVPLQSLRTLLRMSGQDRWVFGLGQRNPSASTGQPAKLGALAAETFNLDFN